MARAAKPTVVSWAVEPDAACGVVWVVVKVELQMMARVKVRAVMQAVGAAVAMWQQSAQEELHRGVTATQRH